MRKFVLQIKRLKFILVVSLRDVVTLRIYDLTFSHVDNEECQCILYFKHNYIFMFSSGITNVKKNTLQQ